MKWERIVVIVALLMLAWSHYAGLTQDAETDEVYMNLVGRIFYVHVPIAAIGLMVYLVALVTACLALWSGTSKWDAMTEGIIEVGLVMNLLTLVQGSIWGKVTWGTWWDWDPRLTTTAIMFVMFLGILVMREMVEDPDRRMTASAVATIVAAVNVPIVYYSVEWWKEQSIHQGHSDQEGTSAILPWPFRIGMLATVLLCIGLSVMRYRISLAKLKSEREAELPSAPAKLDLEEA